MPKKIQELKPDIILKNYWNDKEQFADLFNAVLFDGKSLHGMLNLSEEIRKYVNDYKMLLVEARENKLTLHNINNRDLFQLLQIVLDRNIPKNEAKQKAIQYSREHKVDKTVIMTVAGATNMKLDYNTLAQRGEVDMCTLFEEERLEGKMEGMIKILRKYSVSDEDILKELVSSLKISMDEAEEFLNKYNQDTF